MDSIYELKQRLTLLERAHASAGIGHFVLDPKRQTVEFSSRVRDKLGLNDMPIPLARLPEIVVEEEREEFNRNVSDAIDGKEDFSFETIILTANGKARAQRISGITAFENERMRKGFIGYFGIVQDITREKRSKEELRAARDAMQAELDTRTSILAVVSHEIRTPLGGILGIIDQLKRERSPTERERALTLIEDSSEVLLDTLDAILHQARIGEDVGKLEAKRFAPIAVANRVAELFRPLARRKGLRINVAGASGVYASGDPARLQQIIANFVSNGVKFTQSGAVTINVIAPDTAEGPWTFVIKDTGAGMDKGRVATLFKPFGATGMDSLGRQVGAGLGLSITRDLVKTMGGTIEVKSEPGKGSSFAVSIPFEHAPSEQAEGAMAAKRGRAAILVEGASDRVQVEASVSMNGYASFEIGDELVDAGSTDAWSILIVDQDKLTSLSLDLLASFGLIVAVVPDGSNDSGNIALPSSVETPIKSISNNQIARSLGKVLAEVNDDAS